MGNKVNFKENAFKLTETSIHCHKLFILIETSISRQNLKENVWNTWLTSLKVFNLMENYVHWIQASISTVDLPKSSWETQVTSS